MNTESGDVTCSSWPQVRQVGSAELVASEGSTATAALDSICDHECSELHCCIH